VSFKGVVLLYVTSSMTVAPLNSFTYTKYIESAIFSKLRTSEVTFPAFSKVNKFDPPHELKLYDISQVLF